MLPTVELKNSLKGSTVAIWSVFNTKFWEHYTIVNNIV